MRWAEFNEYYYVDDTGKRGKVSVNMSIVICYNARGCAVPHRAEKRISFPERTRDVK
jgi:hypothetical protein